MKLKLHQVHHRPSETFSALVERHLARIGEHLPIEEARVVIERRLEASPAFHVSAHLVTPGPDVFAESFDHTLRAALEKTVAELEAKIAERSGPRERRPRAEGRKVRPRPRVPAS